MQLIRLEIQDIDNSEQMLAALQGLTNAGVLEAIQKNVSSDTQSVTSVSDVLDKFMDAVNFVETAAKA